MGRGPGPAALLQSPQDFPFGLGGGGTYPAKPVRVALHLAKDHVAALIVVQLARAGHGVRGEANAAPAEATLAER